LRRWIVKIGRWLLDTVLAEGRRGLAVYMRQRVHVFRARRARARTKRRRQWLDGRIRRWTKAAEWFDGEEAARLSKRVAKEAQGRAEAELDELEPELENFRRWNRARARDKRRAKR
jgi:hypothetical protein